MHRTLVFGSLMLLSFGTSASHAASGPNSNAQPPASSLQGTAGLSREPQACALMDAAADPRFLASAMLAGLNPKTYLAFIQRLSNPESVRNKLGALTSQVTMDRAYSQTDPQFQTALLSRATEPKMATKWLDAMRDPAYFQPGVYVSNKPVQWVNVTADGRITPPMVNWLDPKTYMGWIRLMTVPGTPEARDPAGIRSNQLSKPPVFTAPPQRY
jgi:hypothetical protein